jgi:succinoglycan biosynthesis transport protein ExoP
VTVNKLLPQISVRSPRFEQSDKSLDFYALTAAFRRHAVLFLSILLGVIALAAVLTWLQAPKYDAVATVMIEPAGASEVDEDNRQVDPGVGSVAVSNQVALIQSREMAARVANELGLASDPEFRPDDPDGEMTPAEVSRAVTSAVLGGLEVARRGESYILEITYSSEDPRKAARIANAFANTYLKRQVEQQVSTVQASSEVLDDRLGRLREQVERAESAAERYKAANNLMSAEGATLVEQEISNLNQQLAVAQAQQAEQEARLATARSQLSRGSTGDDVGETLNSPVIQQLRQRRTEAGQQVASLSERYGPQHPELIQARVQLEEVDAQIRQEIGRIISNLQAQVEVARQRTQSIESSIARARGTLAASNQATVRLRELERTAEGYRTIFESSRDRYNTVDARTGAEQANAEIVSLAVPPSSASSPNKPLNMALGIALALVLASGAVFLADSLDKGVTTGEDVEREFGVPYLGAIPSLSSTLGKKGSGTRLDPTEFVVAKPLSAFTESLRNLRAALTPANREGTRKVIAVTSALPNEGKSTTCICLARAASFNQKVVLVDCDLRQRKATAGTAGTQGPVTKGIVEVLNGQASLDDVLVADPRSKAFILPVAEGSMPSVDLLASPEMERLLNTLRSRFDLVILDTTPLLGISDSRVVASVADAVVLLARWNRTPRKAIKLALQLLSGDSANIAGVALTLVDARKQARFGYGDAGYYYNSYKGYYLN